MSPTSTTPTDGGSKVVPPDKSLFAEIAPFRLAVGVVFCAFAVAAVAVGWLPPMSADVVGIALLCVVFLAGGFVPFNGTLAFYVAQAAAFLVWGALRLAVDGFDVIPLLLGAAGAVGLAVYGRRALRDGLRALV
ncbi:MULTISPECIES: hypothetical protein [unclassified Haloferax]|uniref:hypothetical protein n=1 Tax=Haloferax TaxID=2251 RepID=UPI0002B0EEE1|nr:MULTISPECIES: hypothetical protein [unclassified Haloferax]ELZ59449.1 hypothetical protein C460_06383 [Haloferax sp. ATCC BAA-646]ELZ64722.1 hypothetical protein C459_09345 [Haloferax sp. ATCC BAA-645]ELZ69444.1 hypothetical protein C458_04149 [Haloferax sp. ATCC BAA-644]